MISARKKESKEFKGMCGILQELIEDAFDDQGVQLQTAFESSFHSAKTVASSPIFRHRGEQMIDKVIKWMYENKIKSREKLKSQVIKEFFDWYSEILKEVDSPSPSKSSQGFHIPNQEEL